MTPAEVSKLTNEELSAALARRVMGWNNRGRLGIFFQFPCWFNDKGVKICDVSAWSPPTSPVDANFCMIRILERCNKIQFHIQRSYPICRVEVDHWDISTNKYVKIEDLTVASHTIMRAESEACLLAAIFLEGRGK